MKYFPFLIVFALFLTACTNTSSIPTLSPTETPIPDNTSTPTPVAPYPSGQKWYVVTGRVSAVTFDKNGYLWTGGVGVIHKWDLSKNTYESFELFGENMPIDISSMVTDKDGVIWVAAEYGVWKYKDGGFVKDLSLSGYSPSLTVAPNGDVIVYSDQTFYLFENGDWKEYQTEHPVESISVSKDGTIWIALFEKGAGNFKNWGVLRFDGKTFEVVPEFSNVNGIYLTKTCEDNIWFYSPGWTDYSINPSASFPAQVVKFDGTNWTTYPQQKKLESSFFYLACDKQNNLQVYSDNNGTTSFAIDQAGNYCFGGYFGVRCNTGNNLNSYLEPGLPDHGILSIAAASDNTLWFGTHDNGAVHFNGKDWEIYTTENGLRSNKINDIKIDRNGVVWFATKDGLAQFDGYDRFSYITADELNYDSIDTIWIGDDNSMWVGGLMGVSYWDGKIWRSYSRDAFPVTQTLSIDVGPDGTAWFGTTDGLVKYDGKNWESFGREDGLKNEWIYGLAATSNNDVWILTSDGLVRFDGIKMHVFDQQQMPIGSGGFEMLNDCTFLVKEGVIKINNDQALLLPWKNFSFGEHSSVVNSIVQASDNSIWFATFEGVLRLSDEFIPEALYDKCGQ